jgi:hypothetical protein
MRRVTGPASIDVPRRLPGGVWGPPPIEARLQYSSNGTPTVTWRDGATGAMVPSSIRDATAARAEMGWPQLFALQIAVVGDKPPPQNPQQDIVVRARVTWAVESAESSVNIGVPWTGTDEVWPAALGNTYLALPAQRVSVEWIGVDASTDAGLALYATVLRATVTIGLASPPQVVNG